MNKTIDNQTKSFGAVKALDGVSVQFDSGMIHGLIGRNGSGKTLLIKCICALITPTSGTITIDGKRLFHDIQRPDNMGAIIEAPGFLPNINAYKNLSLLAGMTGCARHDDIIRAIQTVGLDPNSRKHVGKYSMGMKQRLGIAQAIMENPDTLILDEPMNGLDNSGVADMRNLFKSLRDKGKTIILASHNPLDIDELCDTVHEMDAGHMSLVR